MLEFFKKLNFTKPAFLIFFATLLGFFLRFSQIDINNLVEEENTTVKASAYLYYCQLNQTNCRQSVNQTDLEFTNKLLVTLSGNETKPNLFTQIYFWDWLKKVPTNIHYARAWPHLHAVATSFKIFGISETAARISSVIAGTLLIPVSFYFARYFLGSVNLSLLYSLIISTSFYFIEFSRYARMYAGYILLFQLLVILTHKTLIKTKQSIIYLLLAFICFILAYLYHLLVLVFPLAVLIYGLFYHRKLSLGFLLGLILLAFFSSYYNTDFFHQYFTQWQTQPHWQYFKFIFSTPLPYLISFGIILLNLPNLLSNKKTSYLLAVILSYLTYLVFFSKMPPASAYTIHLLPISLWLVLLSLNKLLNRQLLRKIVFTAVFLISLSKLVLNYPYLYQNKNNQPRLSQAYQIIQDRFQPEDQILAVQIRDYYLQSLPLDSKLINLSEYQTLSLSEFKNLLNQAERSFIVFESEKTVHLKPEIIDYLKPNSQKLAGEGIDNFKVEIYLYQK